MVKRKYVDDAYIEKVEHYLYNNLGLPDDYFVPEARNTFNQEVVDELIHKGEKYIRLKDYDHVIATDKGRFINTGNPRQYTMRFSPTAMHMYVTEEKIDVVKIFEEQGWDYNLKKIKKHYIKNNWRFRDYSYNY